MVTKRINFVNEGILRIQCHEKPWSCSVAEPAIAGGGRDTMHTLSRHSSTSMHGAQPCMQATRTVPRCCTLYDVPTQMSKQTRVQLARRPQGEGGGCNVMPMILSTPGTGVVAIRVAFAAQGHHVLASASSQPPRTRDSAQLGYIKRILC